MLLAKIASKYKGIIIILRIWTVRLLHYDIPGTNVFDKF